jgi:hypothetical protein
MTTVTMLLVLMTFGARARGPHERSAASRPAPPPGLSEPTRRALERSAEGLTETPAPGGGFLLDLQGRYQSAMVATVDDDGGTRVDCVSHAPGEPPRK